MMRNSFWRRYLLPQWRRGVALGVLFLGFTCLQVAGPQMLKRFVDGVRQGEPLRVLLMAAVLFMIFALAAQLLLVGAEFVGGRMAWTATNDLRVDLLDHCLALDLEFFEQHTPGELIERIDGDVGKLASYFSKMFILLAANLLLIVGVGSVLMWEDWRVGIIFVAFVAISVGLLRRLVGRAIPDIVAQRAAEAAQLGYLEERLAGLEDVRGASAAQHTINGFWTRARQVFRTGRRAAAVGVRWPATAELMSSAGYVLALAAGAWLFLAGEISLGTVFALTAYLSMLRVPLFVITTQFKEVEEALAAMRRIREIFAEKATLVDGPDIAPASVPEVVFDGITFGYDPARPVLHNVSFRLAPGQHLGVVGRTGSGKSSLIRLLFRFSDPQQGAVRLAGVDIRSYTLDSLRSRLSLVTQEVQLLHATVRDNVTIFDTSISDKRVVQALTDAGLSVWYQSLPDGLDTKLGAGETGLSAGQEQLLAFARVMAADPALVLLDEATSRLDPATQQSISAATTRLLAGRSAIIVAHRLETLREVDQIMVLDEGRVVEYGTLEQLTKDPRSRFSEMLLSAEGLAR